MLYSFIRNIILLILRSFSFLFEKNYYLFFSLKLHYDILHITNRLDKNDDFVLPRYVSFNNAHGYCTYK
jgi:hypothetical protein